jgi:glycosyltransferase involved in cell wall biosynthesis
MLCELPCIATDVGEVKTILAGVGLLIPSSDPKQFASICIEMLGQTPEVRAQLGALARKRVEEAYSMDLNMERMKALYKE